MYKKKKIAFFTASLGFGGTERVVSLLCNELTKNYDVTIILLFNHIDFDLCKDIKVITIGDKFFNSKSSLFDEAYNFTKYLFRYNKLMKKEKFDLVFSFLARQNIINSVAKLLNPQLKTVISERSYPSTAYGGSKLRRYIIKKTFSIFYNKNNALFSNSIYINEDLKNKYNVKIKSYVIYNPIKKDIIEKSFLQQQSNDNHFKIINVGRLLEQKNQKSLIKAFSFLPKDYQLNIYGKGNLRKELEDLIDTLNLNNRVYLRGTESNIKDRLKEHHCFVLSSVYEGFPNVVLEAMASGTPVVSVNCMSGPLEMLNDNEPVDIPLGSFFKAKYGLLANVNDFEGISKAIIYLKENEAQRKKYSDLAFEKAKTFGIEEISMEMKNLIESLV